MDGPSAFRGVACTECGVTSANAARITACPECGGPLATRYEFDGDLAPDDLPPGTDQYRFSPFLPFDREDAVTLGEGGTPLVDCPALADEVGVGRVLVKDEGANPTGSIADRGASLAVTGASREGDADVGVVALPSTGHGGRSVAAYAGRAGRPAEVFVPARAPFACKAMINVHGGEMTVVGGRYDDAVAAFEDAREDEGTKAEEGREDGKGNETETWADLGPGSAYRQNGIATCYGEVLAALDWSVPDAVVVPTGHGTTVAGLFDATRWFREAGLASTTPAIVVAQAEGCAPVVNAVDRGGTFEPAPSPDTIAGALEVPGPVLGDRAVAAVRETDGAARAVADEEALAAAVETNATAGVEVGVAGGVSLAATKSLASEFAEDATVVVVNPTAGDTESDLLRSRLMGQGV